MRVVGRVCEKTKLKRARVCGGAPAGNSLHAPRALQDKLAMLRLSTQRFESGAMHASSTCCGSIIHNVDECQKKTEN